jgi:uncharacterized protein
MEYYNRYIERQIKEALEISGGVLVSGPKFCGKTTTCKRFASSLYALDTKEKIQLVQSSPLSILQGSRPRLIDEWQNVPDLWNCARTQIDSSEEKFGLFIFTGSSTPADRNEIYHSGAGRFVTLCMNPMSLYESKDSTGEVSLSALFEEPQQHLFGINENYTLQDTAFYLCRGGWPLSVLGGRDKALRITSAYYSTLFEFENSKNAKFRNKKKNIFLMILKSYARNISTEARRKLILDDVNAHEDRNLDEDTFEEYVEALRDLFIIRDIEAWNPNFRSKTAVITSPTRHFVDTSIAAGVLNISPDDLMNDPRTYGMFFEDFAINQLRVYTEALGGEIRHYRDSKGLECDAVVHLNDGRFALVEVKLGGENLIRDGISTLSSLRNKIKTDKLPEPSFEMIITACGNAYTTDTGIHIVPINMLKD